MKTDPLAALVAEVLVRTGRWARWQAGRLARAAGFHSSPWRGL